MPVKLSYVDSYAYYGRCLQMENDCLTLLITVDVGPRIIYLAPKGGENLLYNAKEGTRIDRSPMYKQVFGEDAEYHFYGGHRMWLAPQRLIHTESPDSVPVTVSEVENGVTLICPEATVIGFVSSMTVVMDPDQPQITVTCSFTNTHDEPKQNAVWQVTQCAPGGVVFVPFSDAPKPRKPFTEWTLEDVSAPLKPNASLLKFIGSIRDPRIGIDDAYLTLSFDATRHPLKLGTQNTQGFALYANRGYLLRWDFDHDPNGTYTDGGCSFETYTDSEFTEVESLGQYLPFGKGETITHTETISVQPLKAPIPDPQDRAAVQAFVELHL